MTAMQEVNYWRKLNRLPPVVEDPELTKFAQMKAEYRAKRGLKDGHQGPVNPPGTREGTGEATPEWGWLTCVMEETADEGGAGIAVGADGERYMVLVLRGGGDAPIGRNVRPHDTSFLTPDPPVFIPWGRAALALDKILGGQSESTEYAGCPHHGAKDRF